MPKISIIIPTFNRVDLLKEAVDSVIKQTHDDYELIIVDNHSNDGTEKYCKDISSKYEIIQYFRNDKNLGMIGNWNVGLEKTKGKYISVLMDDDLLKKDFLSKTEKILDAHPKVGFVYSWIEYAKINQSGMTELITDTPSKFKPYSKNMKLKSEDGLKKYIGTKLQVGLPSGMLFRKSDDRFDEIGLDPGFWLMQLSKYKYYYYLNKIVCTKRIHQGDQFSDQKPKRHELRRFVYNMNYAYNKLLLSGRLDEETEIKYFNRIKKLSKTIFPKRKVWTRN